VESKTIIGYLVTSTGHVDQIVTRTRRAPPQLTVPQHGRDRAIERGEIGVEAAELELLVGYLDVPLQAMWKERDSLAVRRVVRLGPGEVVQVIAAERGGGDG